MSLQLLISQKTFNVSHSVVSNSFATPWIVSPPGSSVHGILQARILEWVSISFSRWSSWPRDWTWVSCIAGRFYTIWAMYSPWNSLGQKTGVVAFPFFRGSSQLRDRTQFSCIAGRFFTNWNIKEAYLSYQGSPKTFKE